MTKRALMASLIVVVVFQAGVLAAEYLGAMYPLWTGTEVRLKVVPVDPRSLFRGNYARLRYDISFIEHSALEWVDCRAGDVMYVRLKPGEDGLHEFDGASFQRPESGLFLRGRLQAVAGRGSWVSYGIEAFFAPKDKAQALERDLRQGGVAEVMVASNGKATLKDVIASH